MLDLPGPPPSRCPDCRATTVFDAIEAGHFRGWQDDGQGGRYPFCDCPQCQRSYLLSDYRLP